MRVRAGMALVVVAVVLAAVASTREVPLAEAAAGRGVVVGTAVDADALRDDADYRRVLLEQFAAVTPENAMKWDAVAPERGRFDFAAADRVVDFATTHGKAVRAHTLVWHNQTPDWVRRLSPPELEAALRTHVAEVVGRYAGRIDSWDVVNEPLRDDGTLRSSFWLQALGDGYIAAAFREARRHDSGARLLLNEYGAESVNAKSDGLLRLVRELRAAGVPVDGVGFQSHFRVGEVPADLAANLRRFADLGVDVAITELDVRVPLPASRADLDRQAEDYRAVVAACLSVPRCTGVTTWGFTDARSWVGETFPGWGAALPWDERLAPKPARDAMGRALRDHGPGHG